MNNSGPSEFWFIGPDHGEIMHIVEAAFSEEGLIARAKREETFLQSAAPPVHIDVTIPAALIVALGILAKGAIEGFGKKIGEEAAGGTLSVIRSMTSALVRTAQRIKEQKGRDTFFTLEVDREGGFPLRYNVPSIDQLRAIEDIASDSMRRGPAADEFWWSEG